MIKLDVLAFGAHPDDVELSCSGLLLVEKQRGKRTGIIDLTEGELGSRGDVVKRYEESAKSSEILGLDIRENLKLSDGFFQNDKNSQLEVIKVIRKYQPEIVVCNAPDDRHPDHGRGAQLASDASFLSGLLKIETEIDGIQQNPWRPKYVLHYVQDRYLEPDFLIDISDVFEAKINSILSYSSQFYNPEYDGPETYISKPGFLEGIRNRNMMMGKRIGVAYAEGFISKKKIGLRNLDALIKENT